MRRSNRTVNIGQGSWRGGYHSNQQNQISTMQQVPTVAHQQYQQDETMDYYAGQKTDQSQTQSQPMEVTTENGAPAEGEKKFPPWKRVYKNADGKIIKKKKDPNAINLRLRKYVQPKNAVMCLNELKKVNYVTESDGPGQPTCVVVEVDGQEFRGYGSSKQLAKQAAAEAALCSFVKPPSSGASDDKMEANGTGEEAETPKDQTPWATLASFAMYKLFSDWREGRVGVCGSMPNSPYYGGSNVPAGMVQALQQLITGSVSMNNSGTPEATSSALSVYLNKPEGTGKLPMAKRLKFPTGTGVQEVGVKGMVKAPLPCKTLPANAASMHPVMLLHQMRPTAVFEQTSVTNTTPKMYTLSSTIDEKVFTGEGTNLKKAKFELAKVAVQDLFGVFSTWTPAEKQQSATVA